MCGIAGIISYEDLGKTWPEQMLYGMTQALSHRGPDGSGRFYEPGIFLGHTRLAIIDVSDFGRQPMVSADKRFVISFNGEIYNFADLRRQLEKHGYNFRSRSDTEVLLYAWAHWNRAALEIIDGIFAFAVYDRKEKSLTLVRDHMGVKPLFYYEHKKQVFFASEPGAMFGPHNPYPDIDEEDLDAYFTFNYTPAQRTGFKGVYALPPGCILTVNSNGVSLSRYWASENLLGMQAEPHNPVEQFSELLKISCASQTVSDVPLGLFLSSGLDSFAVADAVVSSKKNPTSFTLGFEEKKFDESQFAQEYARHLNIGNKTVTFDWSEQSLRETLDAMNELLADASCFPIYQLSKFAKESVTVVLSGDGGDELLAGYGTYLAGNITTFLRMAPDSALQVLAHLGSYLPSDNQPYGWRIVINRLISSTLEGPGRDHASFRRIFSRELKVRLYEPELLKKVRGFDPVEEYTNLIYKAPKSRSYLFGRQYADLTFHLPSILAKVDRMSMAHGLEARVPLLSKHFVEFCSNLPDQFKYKRGKGKRILRDALSGRIPAGGLKRLKKGFLPPVDKWFRVNGPMSIVFREFLDVGKSQLGWLKWKEVEKLWEEHRAGKVDAGMALLGILQFINWRLKCHN